MIDLNTEIPIPLEDARKHRLILAGHGKKGVAFSTIWTWVSKGKGGVLLDAVEIGNALCTTEQELIRFFRATTKLPSAKRCKADSKAQRRDSHRRAGSVLDAAGI